MGKMIKVILNAIIISLLYLTYRSINTPEFTFTCSVSLVFIWFLKIFEERT